jgi:hypothetical protein
MVGITGSVAGLGGRIIALGFKVLMATAFEKREPGIVRLGISRSLAGLGGRSRSMGFMAIVATANNMITPPGARRRRCANAYAT